MEIIDVLKKIEENGFQVYIVGGYVRDYLLGRETFDVDICTNATVLDLLNLFDNVSSYSLEFGNVKLFFEKYNFDITSLRKEVYQSSRRDVVISFVDDIKVDVNRRDFTMNCLYMNSAGKIIDLVNGRRDINEHIIRCNGDIKSKMTEDPLRILRAIRFATVLNFDLEDELYIFMKNNGMLLKNISTLRIKEELEKIFLSDNIIKGLFYLSDLNLWRYMGISFEKISKVNNLYGMFAQFNLSREYPFRKEELNYINDLKYIVSCGKIDEMIIYKYGIEKSLISGKIMGVDQINIYNIYDNMIIKCESDIKITKFDIYNLFEGKVKRIDKIFDELAFLILKGLLLNQEKIIEEYLLSNREKWLCEGKN